MIDVLYFARVREALGQSHERLDRSEDLATVADLIDHLRARGGVWATTLSRDETLLTAVNQEIARADTPIRDGDEIAIFPPVTGG